MWAGALLTKLSLFSLASLLAISLLEFFGLFLLPLQLRLAVDDPFQRDEAVGVPQRETGRRGGGRHPRAGGGEDRLGQVVELAGDVLHVAGDIARRADHELELR